jgi:uncharacterized membrane protein
MEDAIRPKSIFNGNRFSWANRVILIFFFGKITVVSVNGFFLWLGRLQFLFASVIIYGKICKYFRGREIPPKRLEGKHTSMPHKSTCQIRRNAAP